MRRYLTLVCCLTPLLAGCPKAGVEQPDKRPLDGVKLRLAVADDPALTAALLRVRGEWTAQTGAEFEVLEVAEKDLEHADVPPADALLCPSHALSGLAERDLLAPVPDKVLREATWGDIFDTLKLREAAWGNRTLAIPFGSPVFCCYYRADLLKKLGHQPPRTWIEYQDLAKLLKSPLPLGEGQGVRAAWCGAIEPLAPGWAGVMLLARAAPYAKHRDNYSTLFNIDTMEPLIAVPPMVEVLEELTAAAKFGPADPFHYGPAEARAAFWSGQCGMAISWPSAADGGRKGEGGRGIEEGGGGKAEGGRNATARTDSQMEVGIVELPGSQRMYNCETGKWDARGDDDEPCVPLLAIAGRVGVVSRKSEHVDAAFQLLVWLSDGQMSPQISAASPNTTLFRRSHLTSPARWVERTMPAPIAAKYAEQTEAAFRHRQWLAALRLPGRAEYLAALDEAVAAAVRGEKTPAEALQQAAAKWRQITERLGVDRQRSAYRHSLGLE